MKTTRRKFLISSAGAISAMALTRQASAVERVDENSALAKQLGYKHDAAQIDAAAQPKFKPGEHCANCALYQGKPGDAWGPCPIFSGNDVSEKGWCSAYTPKA